MSAKTTVLCNSSITAAGQRSRALSLQRGRVTKRPGHYSSLLSTAARQTTSPYTFRFRMWRSKWRDRTNGCPRSNNEKFSARYRAQVCSSASFPPACAGGSKLRCIRSASTEMRSMREKDFDRLASTGVKAPPFDRCRSRVTSLELRQLLGSPCPFCRLL